MADTALHRLAQILWQLPGIAEEACRHGTLRERRRAWRELLPEELRGGGLEALYVRAEAEARPLFSSLREAVGEIDRVRDLLSVVLSITLLGGDPQSPHRDVGDARCVGLKKQCQHKAADLWALARHAQPGSAPPPVAHDAGGPAPTRTRQPQADAPVMPSAAEDKKGGEPPAGPEPYPVHDAAVKASVDNLADLLRPAPPSIALTPDDSYLLAILNAHHPTALTQREIVNESVRLNAENPRTYRRLSERVVQDRVQVLLAVGYVAKPPNTVKRGVAITDLGRQALPFAAGNTPEVRRKK